MQEQLTRVVGSASLLSARLGGLGLRNFFGNLGYRRHLRGVRRAVLGYRQDLANLRRAAQVVKPAYQAGKAGKTTTHRGHRQTPDRIVQLHCEQGPTDGSKKRGCPRQEGCEQPSKDAKEQTDPAHYSGAALPKCRHQGGECECRQECDRKGCQGPASAGKSGQHRQRRNHQSKSQGH
jgi:hypothetical protein